MCECSVFPVIDLPGTGRNIRRLRERAGVTVRELQAYFGFEYPQAIYKWQHGECLPSVDNLLALARVLRVPMEDLLVYDDREVSYFWFRRPEDACKTHTPRNWYPDKTSSAYPGIGIQLFRFLRHTAMVIYASYNALKDSSISRIGMCWGQFVSHKPHFRQSEALPCFME